MGIIPLAIAMALLIDCVGQPVQRPYLSTVGMSADLHVYAKRIRMRQSVWLMVKHQHRTRRIGLFEQFLEGKPVRIGAVVTPDDLKAAWQRLNAVAQKTDLRPRKVRLTRIDSADEFMIARDHIYAHGSLETIKRLGKRFIQQGLDAVVDEVSDDEHHIRILPVYHIHIPLQGPYARAMSKVHIADCYGRNPVHRLVKGDVEMLDLLEPTK